MTVLSLGYSVQRAATNTHTAEFGALKTGSKFALEWPHLEAVDGIAVALACAPSFLKSYRTDAPAEN